jgi:adenylosuccinate lyase
VIQRYTRPQMGAVWEGGRRFHWMLEVEKAVADEQATMGLIPKEAAAAIRAKGKFSVARIEEIEATTKHDVIAFVSNVAEEVGEAGRYVHFGLTSSDVLDTALSLQILEAAKLVDAGLLNVMAALKEQVQAHADLLCAGRTHGMHAEPTSFGMKLAGHYEEFARNKIRFEVAVRGISIAKLSGAVGTSSTLPPELEGRVANRLGLRAETIATQVIPRDRMAELFCSLTLIGAAVERLAVELRHLQRTEVGEVKEGFGRGQKGSSAMPHKRNPISAENLTGLARLLRGYLHPVLEDVALWHERDISHSSVERVVMPDAFILVDYALARMSDLIRGLEVVPEKMASNMRLSGGMLFSSHLLLELVASGLSREKAYEVVQRLSLGLKPGEQLMDACLADAECKKRLKEDQIRKVFSGETHRQVISEKMQQWLKG